jgi:hypothetical protein
MRAVVSGLASALLLGSALAADQTVLGSRMRVSDPLPGVNPSQRTVLVIAKERPTDETIVGDPVADGATLELIVNGTTSTSQSIALPAGAPPISTGPGWVSKVIPGTYAIFKYVDKNGEASPVVYLLLKWKVGSAFGLKVKLDAQGNNPPIDVVPGNPTSDLGIRLTLGTGDTYCVLFGGAAGGTVVDGGPQVVKAAKPTGEGCPVAAP